MSEPTYRDPNMNDRESSLSGEGEESSTMTYVLFAVGAVVIIGVLVLIIGRSFFSNTPIMTTTAPTAIRSWCRGDYRSVGADYW